MTGGSVCDTAGFLARDYNEHLALSVLMIFDCFLCRSVPIPLTGSFICCNRHFSMISRRNHQLTKDPRLRTTHNCRLTVQKPLATDKITCGWSYSGSGVQLTAQKFTNSSVPSPSHPSQISLDGFSTPPLINHVIGDREMHCKRDLLR